MLIVHWQDQTMFGPFESLDAAVEWCEKKFGPDWQNILSIHAVEKP